MNEKLHLGSTVKIPDELHSALDKLMESNQTAQEGMWYFTQQYKVTGKWLWELLHDTYPELKDFQCSVNHITKEVTVIGYLGGGKMSLGQFESELKAIDPDAEFDFEKKEVKGE